MKHLLVIPLLAGLCSCAAIPEKPREIDVYETGRTDLNGDGIPEQIVITSGGGSGGPVWYLARLSGEELSEEMQGRLWIAPGKTGYPDLIVRQRCGREEYRTSYLRYDGEKYRRIGQTTGNDGN